jgi:hypothetical protein
MQLSVCVVQAIHFMIITVQHSECKPTAEHLLISLAILPALHISNDKQVAKV